MINRLKTHEFHFVLNEVLKMKLAFIGKILNLNLSKTILFILEKAYPLIKKMHLKNHIENNKMEVVNWNAHLHIYFTNGKQKLYNELKSIHKDCNSYSIAVKLREILKIFIRGSELFGIEKFLMILERAETKLKKIIKRKKVWKKVKVRQLSKMNYICINYDANYIVTSIKLLN